MDFLTYILGMADRIPASLFYDASRAYSVGELKLHLILEERHAVDVSVTEHPVQDGSVISDHATVALREGSLRALVTNSSIRGDEGMPNVNKALRAWERLKSIAEDMQPVTIVTVMETYTDVIVTHVGAMRDGDSGDGQEFDVTFKQVKRVRLKEDEITAVVSPKDMGTATNRRIAPNVDSGQITATPASSGTDIVLDNVDIRADVPDFNMDINPGDYT